MINYKEIFDAWKISIKPSAKQEELAKKRLDVCITCDYRKEVLKGVTWSAFCDDCGCPLNKKIFSTKYNACTQKKWKNVDSEYLEEIDDKKNETLI
jgi:hypothetical protein